MKWTSSNFNQSSEQCRDHFIKKASSKDMCNYMNAGLEMAFICPALNMAKVIWGLGVLVTVDLPVACLHSHGKKDPLYPHIHQKHRPHWHRKGIAVNLCKTCLHLGLLALAAHEPAERQCLYEVQGRRILLLDKNHWQAPGNYSPWVFYTRCPAT